MLSPTRATLIGSTAVLMWSTLALLTTLSGNIPPFQLTAMAFTIAFAIGLGLWVWEGGDITRHVRLPLRVWLLGIGGLFGFHFFYFMALDMAPPVQASLTIYLWPLLVVVLAAVLLREPWRWFHLAGAGLGFVGVVLLVTGGRSFALQSEHVWGYASAVISAVIWSFYSVLSRKVGNIPTSAVGAFCGATAVLSLLCHLLWEQTIWPQGSEWTAVVLLGIGPIGLAFFAWDLGVKQGNIKLLGTISYAAPPLSTLLLVLFGQATPSWLLLIACGFIVGGALLASKRG